MSKTTSGLGFESLEGRIVLTASVGETAIDFSADVRPAEFHDNHDSWINLQSMTCNFTRQLETKEAAPGDFAGQKVEQKVRSFASDYGLTDDPTGDASADEAPMEQLSLNFVQIPFEYEVPGDG